MTMFKSTATKGSSAGSKLSLGRSVSRLLTGCWWANPTPADVSVEELTPLADLLLRSGAAGLAWRRLRDSESRHSAVARELQQAYRFQALQSALQEWRLMQVLPALRAAGVDPVLVKGWAIARLYPEPGLRSYCDHDLCVRPEQYTTASAVLAEPEYQGCGVDLHCGFDKFYAEETEQVFERAQLVKLSDLDVRVLAAEDHLRLLCVHLLRHGVERPIWLCDVAVALETRPPDFNWDRCLGGDCKLSDWVACAIGLAHQLLCAEIAGTPVAARASSLPSWLVPSVQKQWGSAYHSPLMVSPLLRRPVGLLKELPRHWPNPIVATVAGKGRFSEFPRLPFQIGHVLSRAAALLFRIPASLRETTQQGN